jgi:hypothetical protein
MLLKEIRAAQEHLVEIADHPATADATARTTPTIEQFLSGLRTAWQEREVRPTNKPKAKAPRGRGRSDPFVAVTERVREWFEAEPWRTLRELFERLQSEWPGVFPDGQLRTLQRRLKEWRREDSVANRRLGRVLAVLSEFGSQAACIWSRSLTNCRPRRGRRCQDRTLARRCGPHRGCRALC